MKFKWQLILVLVLGFASAPSWGENDLEKKQAQQALSQLKKEISALQKNLKSKQKQQSQAITNLQNSEKQIATATKILGATNRQLISKEAELRKLRSQQKDLDASKLRQKKALAAQMRSAFMNGKQEYLKMLLNQQDPAELGRMLIYYDYMNKARAEKVKRLQETLLKLENIDAAIQSEIQDLKVLKASKEAETARLKKLKEKRKQLIADLAKDIKTKTEKLTEMQINAEELQQLVESVQQAIESIDFSQPLDGLKNLKGKLKWPTRGKTLRNYGARLPEGLTSNGILIGANEGNPVNAIHYGRVVYADWLRGFGLLIIVDHGKGYMSLYGYNQALYKQVGDWVEAGESIATVGQSGGQPRSSLYFEMRYQGKPVNPKRWVR
ncbi:murein hydrolase activator EnvC family protein [Aliikangiella sp. IMCC44632]